ncbi:MAG TPA: ATP-binding protein [Burkholderiaceae bacterium]|nr:ATP-binding protein [Burkholderiaceae bacterium]
MKLRSPSLFWRTFLLIALLLAGVLAALVQSFRLLEREPRAQHIAQQVTSIVNITRGALLYSDPALRRELLDDLADNEGIRIAPREATDRIVALPDRPLTRLILEKIQAELGPDTIVASEVNGVPGNWVSFTIDGDGYWVFIEREPLTRSGGPEWARWAVITTVLAVLVAIAITRVVNRPLKRLSQAAAELGAGHKPAPLPENGPVEIRTVNQSFNRMVADLAKLEHDRALLLAGISHDLRTPLTRLRLELDLTALPESTRAAMIDDIEQMDAIVGQFLDYARPAPQQAKAEVDLSALVEAALAHVRADEATQLNTDVAPGIRVEGYATELRRALDNLLTNAMRYGRDAQSGRLALHVELHNSDGRAVVAVEDHGPGIAEDIIPRLLRPFERGDTARGGHAGAGLGLSIVERIARLHGGSLKLRAVNATAPHGLRVELELPLTKDDQRPD